MKTAPKGFTLVELMICCAIIMIIAPMMTNILLTSLRSQRQISDRITGQQQAQLLFDLIARDVRAAATVEGTSNQVVLQPTQTSWQVNEGKIIRLAGDTRREWQAPYSTTIIFFIQSHTLITQFEKPPDRHNSGWRITGQAACRVASREAVHEP